MTWLTHNDPRWLESSVRVRQIKSVPMSTVPCVLELVPLPDTVIEGSTFRKPVPKREPALRDWLPCWFGGLDQATKDEA